MHMRTMENLIAVQDNADGIIGKFLYYSTSNILIKKEEFIKIGMSFGLPKYQPAKESKAGIYRKATTAIKDRVTVKDGTGTHTYRIYCRDNKREDDEYIYREPVKETMKARTNTYEKLANIFFDKRTETITYDNVMPDPDIDVEGYCRQAIDNFERLFSCYDTEQVDAVIKDILDRMQANKISIHGNLYFVPKQYLSILNIFEDFIDAIAKQNLNEGNVMSNSMFVVDDERQRQKMTEEFYENYRRDIDFYKQRIQHFIDSGCGSKTVIERWMQKIAALTQKKAVYEEVLKRKLDALNSDYEMLKMQSNELLVRNNVHGQMKLPMVA